ncbi:MAG: PRC-barrel domain-containing protein [Candidatus Gracilibacteria bacterium]|jgi:sporulation protein YlmC with PRC-barrel domain
MKLHWSQLDGLAVISSEEDRPFGFVTGVFMHPETGQIIGLLLGYSKMVVPVDIEQWNKDYIRVSGPEAFTTPLEILRIQEFGLRRTFLNNKRVLAKNGQSLGRVRDFCLDTNTSFLLSIEVSKKFLWMEWDKRTFDYSDISAVTEKAIVLTVEPEEKEKAGKIQVPALT